MESYWKLIRKFDKFLEGFCERPQARYVEGKKDQPDIEKRGAGMTVLIRVFEKRVNFGKSGIVNKGKYLETKRKGKKAIDQANKKQGEIDL